MIATGRNEALLEALRTEAAGHLSTLSLDVTDPRSIEAAREELHRLTDGRGVDVLINNAGYGSVAPIIETSDADLRAQFDTNVFGLMAVTRALVPAMMARRSGRIINVSSIAGRATFPFFGPYNATKYALESLSNALRIELAPFGIDVAVIEPGAVRTQFYGRFISDAPRYGNGRSAYAAVLENPDALERTFHLGVTSPEAVTRCFVHAIESRRPRTRYVVPFSARLLLATLALTPTRLSDWFFSVAVGLTASRLRAGASDPLNPTPAPVKPAWSDPS